MQVESKLTFSHTVQNHVNEDVGPSPAGTVTTGMIMITMMKQCSQRPADVLLVSGVFVVHLQCTMMGQDRPR